MGRTIHIWALSTYPGGISGGDKIFIECARHWSQSGHRVTIYTNESGEEMIRRHEVSGINIVLVRSNYFHRFGFFFYYVARIIQGCLYAMNLNLPDEAPLLYSASDFWADSLPAAILKSRYPESRWIAGFYFFAPSPFQNSTDIEYRGGTQPVSVKSILYYLTQQMVYPLIKGQTDGIIVANQLDRLILEKEGISMDRTFAIYGGVDLPTAEAAKPRNGVSYDGCFLGRFHVQKGVLFLVPIWKEVVKVLPKAKLAIIGDGSLRKEIEQEIRRHDLSESITLFGYLDGEEKYSLFKSSKVFLHTPLWDTGGMAAAEAMACGLPVVAFDLPGYQYTYPQGMLKARREDVKHYASQILDLLTQPPLYSRIQKEAQEFVKAWDWKARAQAIQTQFISHFQNEP